MLQCAAALILLLLTAAPARARPLDGLQVPALVIETYDADTWTVDAYHWPDVTRRAKIRVRGVDAPEIRGACDAEKTLALAGRAWAERFIGERVLLRAIDHDKFGGRMDATVILPDGRDLAEALYAANLVRRYHGGRRQGWCPVPAEKPAPPGS